MKTSSLRKKVKRKLNKKLRKREEQELKKAGLRKSFGKFKKITNKSDFGQ